MASVLTHFRPSSFWALHKGTSQILETLDQMGILDTSLKLMSKFCLHPKSAQKRKRRGKRIVFGALLKTDFLRGQGRRTAEGSPIRAHPYDCGRKMDGQES